MVREIPLTQARVALVDDEDYERVADKTWHLARAKSGHLYAKHGWRDDGKVRGVYMHRYLLGLIDSAVHVDHINGDGLDNRRANLRTANPLQNRRNSRPQATSSTGFKGVAVGGNYFHAMIMQTFLGAYDTAEEAARIYDAAATILYGDFAWTNYPEIDPESLDRASRILNGDTSAMPPRRRGVRRLTDDDVRDIRRRYAKGGVIMTDLAGEYDVTTGAIQHAISGRTFAHITDPPPITRDMRGNRRSDERAA